ncbi:MAG TPA: ABC transporter permease [Candidatus Saccharimonadales bacterium]|nr:ABC transporter permease [Candidatus Saccharimonadales bacterium]
MKRKLFTVYVFTKLNTRRFFRDRLALFFGILFPVIFLFVFGGISGNGTKNVSFNVAILNQSKSQFSQDFVKDTNSSKVFKVHKDITTLEAAKDKMNKSQLDATLVLPADFGARQDGQKYPSGEVQVFYTQNNQTAGTTLVSALQEQFKGLNAKFVTTELPFTVVGKPTADKALTQFDYTFAGLLGFSILGLGIFGPMNVFPELKKQGILRRFHTTPLRVWQYFLSTMISQAIIGLLSLGVMFVVAMKFFHLHVVGNFLEIAAFLVFSIILILGIGLALGGWAKNERQAAPLGNIITFPMMFLSGTFFPRFLMPEWLQNISGYLPLSPVIDGARLMVTEGKHLIDLGAQLGIMAVWVVVIYIIAFRVFRWE